jgi:hypothetical protein
MFWRTAFVFIVLVFESPVVAFAEMSSSSLNKLMKYTGINKQMAGFSDMVMAGFGRNKEVTGKISAEQHSEIDDIVHESFEASKITDLIKKNVNNEFSEEEARQLLSWYRSPLGVKIVAAEDKTSSHEAYQKMVAESDRLLANQERVAIAQKIDSLVKATEMTQEVQRTGGEAMIEAMVANMQGSDATQVAMFKAAILPLLEQQSVNSSRIVTLMYIYAYRNIAISDLNKYVKFLENPVSQRFYRNVLASMKIALNDSVGDMSGAIARMYQED